MSKVIVHIDLNAFFARAEEIKDPSLINKPVAIGHDGRGGIVSTASYKAREFGVHSAMPMFKAKELCPNLIIKKCDYRFYNALSSTFINFIKRYTPLVEQASVDECFADFTDVVKKEKDPIYFFKKLQQDLFKETKLKCSIGVAPTKFLAKMASDIKKPMGLTFIRRRDIPNILYPLPIKDMFGVGKKTYPRLMDKGINTIGDLAKALNEEDPIIIDLLGKFHVVLKEWVNGYGDNEIVLVRDDPKSISHSQTLIKDTDVYEDIRLMYENISKELSYKAKQEGKKGTTIQISIKDTNFKVFNKSITFDKPINDWKEIYNYSIKLYEKNFSGILIRQVGIALQNLVSPKDEYVQMSLFNDEEQEEENSTKLLINELNKRLSKPMLMRASEVEKK